MLVPPQDFNDGIEAMEGRCTDLFNQLFVLLLFHVSDFTDTSSIVLDNNPVSSIQSHPFRKVCVVVVSCFWLWQW